ncbi:type VII secretion target [Rhodococcus marinonascens]|uniref:type VII secretion target n=1 Tax=Rhodococcus marinonascens TaxID=38311 RepID=UPI0009334B80|nr:type VII secretion target [Rhodococcus marinonascens]
MSDSIEVDTASLRTASMQLDALVDDASAKLTATDRDISDSGTAWKHTSATAFGEFASYLDDRRERLQRNIFELSSNLDEAALRYDTQDRTTAGAADSPTSLNL